MNYKRIAMFALLIWLVLFLLIVPGRSAHAWSEDLQRAFITRGLGTQGLVQPPDGAQHRSACLWSFNPGNVSPTLGSTSFSPALQELSIVIETDSFAYGIGDDVTITVTLTNPSDTGIAGDLNLAVQIAWLDSPAWTPVFTAQPRPFNLPAQGEIQETYKLTMGQYKDSGLFRIVASAGEAVKYGGFVVTAGYDLTLQVPDSVKVGEDFEVALEVKNTLTRAINNLAVDVLFPTGSSLEAGSEHLVIPSLAAGDTHRQTWKMSVEEGGFNNLVAVATSEDGGSNKVVISMSVLGEAEIIPVMEDVEEVARGSSVTLRGEVHNVGGQTAEGVQATLTLPPELATTESLTIDVGDIPGGESKAVSWTVEALSPGRYAVELKASDTAGHEGTGVGFVTVIGGPGPGTPEITELGAVGDGNGDGLCTEVDALMALKMAVGLQAPDVARMDVNGDGQVTEVDALQILKWAVAGGQCGGAAPAPPTP